MGCDYYEYASTLIHFSDHLDNVRCLCTFPMNDERNLEPDRVRSLAMLGAAVALLHTGSLPLVVDEDTMLLPSDLPDWIIEGINRCVPDTGDNG